MSRAWRQSGEVKISGAISLFVGGRVDGQTLDEWTTGVGEQARVERVQADDDGMGGSVRISLPTAPDSRPVQEIP